MALILAQQGQPFRLTGPATFALSGGLALWLLRRNLNAAAFSVLSYGSWLATVIALSYTGGLHGNSALALPIIILFSAWLVGIRAMLLLGGATIAVLLGYAFLEMYGLLPVRAATPILQRSFIMSVIVLTATALGYFAARTLAEQMTALKASGGELESKMAALARREQELSLVAEHVPAMIAHYDSDRTCRFANSAYAGFVGKTPESILGRRAEDIIGTAAYADIEPAIARVLGGEAVRLAASRVNAAGESRSLAVELVPDVGSRGADGWYALIRDVTESERAAKSLRHIIDGTARATGSAFFQALTLNLAQATGLGRAMVAEVLPDRRHARAIAYWDGRDFRQGMEYLLEDAPCQQVIDKGEACFVDGVAELFPKDLALALALHGIRGYYGARLESSDGMPLGVLVVMDEAPIRRRAEIASLVTVFAARAAAELERLRAEAALRSTGERFASVFAASPTPIALTSLADGRFADVNPAYEKTFGWTRQEMLGRSALDLGIWPSHEERRRWVAELEANHRTRDFETIHLTKTGEPLTILLWPKPSNWRACCTSSLSPLTRRSAGAPRMPSVRRWSASRPSSSTRRTSPSRATTPAARSCTGTAPARRSTASPSARRSAAHSRNCCTRRKPPGNSKPWWPPSAPAASRARPANGPSPCATGAKSGCCQPCFRCSPKAWSPRSSAWMSTSPN